MAALLMLVSRFCLARYNRRPMIAASKHLSVEAARDAVEHAENGISSSYNETTGLHQILFF
jgi:hypothetical protein